jgi:hypothetical protein
VNVAIDVKGTADAFPHQMSELMSALKAAGNGVVILTGVEKDRVGQADVDTVRSYLDQCGITPAMYDQIIVCPRPHPKHKVQAMKDNDIDLLVDNKKSSARKATKAGLMAMVPWATREK